MPIVGIDLKVERVRAKVKTQALADAMCVSRATLYNIENAGTVTPDRAKQYRQALRALVDDMETSAREAVA